MRDVSTPYGENHRQTVTHRGEPRSDEMDEHEYLMRDKRPMSFNLDEDNSPSGAPAAFLMIGIIVMAIGAVAWMSC